MDEGASLRTRGKNMRSEIESLCQGIPATRVERFPYSAAIFDRQYPLLVTLGGREVPRPDGLGDVLFRHYKLFHFEMGQMELQTPSSSDLACRCWFSRFTGLPELVLIQLVNMILTKLKCSPHRSFYPYLLKSYWNPETFRILQPLDDALTCAKDGAMLNYDWSSGRFPFHPF